MKFRTRVVTQKRLGLDESSQAFRCQKRRSGMKSCHMQRSWKPNELGENETEEHDIEEHDANETDTNEKGVKAILDMLQREMDGFLVWQCRKCCTVPPLEECEEVAETYRIDAAEDIINRRQATSSLVDRNIEEFAQIFLPVRASLFRQALVTEVLSGFACPHRPKPGVAEVPPRKYKFYYHIC